MRNCGSVSRCGTVEAFQAAKDYINVDQETADSLVKQAEIATERFEALQ